MINTGYKLLKEELANLNGISITVTHLIISYRCFKNKKKIKIKIH